MLPPTGRGEATKVFVTADAASNAVLIRAPEGERAMLEKMIASLDKEESISARETRLLPLTNASAAEVAGPHISISVADIAGIQIAQNLFKWASGHRLRSRCFLRGHCR